MPAARITSFDALAVYFLPSKLNSTPVAVIPSVLLFEKMILVAYVRSH